MAVWLAMDPISPVATELRPSEAGCKLNVNPPTVTIPVGTGGVMPIVRLSDGGVTVIVRVVNGFPLLGWNTEDTVIVGVSFLTFTVSGPIVIGSYLESPEYVASNNAAPGLRIVV